MLDPRTTAAGKAIRGMYNEMGSLSLSFPPTLSPSLSLYLPPFLSKSAPSTYRALDDQGRAHLTTHYNLSALPITHPGPVADTRWTFHTFAFQPFLPYPHACVCVFVCVSVCAAIFGWWRFSLSIIATPGCSQRCQNQRYFDMTTARAHSKPSVRQQTFPSPTVA